jgi:hypothetical protein
MISLLYAAGVPLRFAVPLGMAGDALIILLLVQVGRSLT